MYGQFHRGDSYIVLLTTKEEEGDGLLWDVFFWIGSESSQDEYGVAAYKANELGENLCCLFVCCWMCGLFCVCFDAVFCS